MQQSCAAPEMRSQYDPGCQSEVPYSERDEDCIPEGPRAAQRRVTSLSQWGLAEEKENPLKNTIIPGCRYL